MLEIILRIVISVLTKLAETLIIKDQTNVKESKVERVQRTDIPSVSTRNILNRM